MGIQAPDNYPGDRHDYRQDEHTARLALRYLTAKKPRFMFVGLGDADEYGHRNDYHGYLGALRAADRFIGDVFAALDTMGERGKRTVVIVTTDHGRENGFRDHGGEFPESSRVWMVAAGGDVPVRGITQASRPLHLYDIAPTLRVLMALPDQPSEGKPIEEITGASDDPRLARP
jgi:arylsulfatase A-like enzyme